MPSYFEKYGQTFITLAAIIAAFVGLVTINGNRFDAQERFNGQFFELIHQRLNAQEALINQRLNAQDTLISERFDAQDRLINQRFDAQDALINQRFDAQDQRFDAQDQRLDDHAKRLDRLTDEVSELRRIMVSVSERVSRNEGEIDVIREQLRIADTPSP